jgi:hypothetical protein
MPSACNPEKIIAALYEQTEVITDIVREEIKDSPNLALRMIPDGGVVKRNANNSSVIYGEAKQASVAYNSRDHSERALVEGGEFKGRTLHGTNGIFGNLTNDIDDNACHGQHTIDFSQGFRIREFEDFELSLDTPTKCARELDRLGEMHIRGYFNGMKNQFTRWGMANFSDNLLNLVIRHGEANASVLAADQFNVSAGGWQAPPQYRITIHFLQDYRDHIMAELRGRGFTVREDWMLEVEMPRLDWQDAVIKDKIERDITGTQYLNEQDRDTEGPMKGRQSATYGGIKCYFNETPIRGYFKQTGTSGGNPIYSFVRVYDWKNTLGEDGGLVTGRNHDYRKDSITVDGIKHDMVTLIPHIDARSFKRYGLMKPIKPIGDDNSGVNYAVKVVDGSFIPCNEHNDKFKLVARHEFRFKAKYPEFSGFIAYRHSQRPGYVLEVTERNYSPGPDNFAGPEVFESSDTDACSQAECAQCGKVADHDGQCVAPESVEDSVLGLSPAGTATTVFEGEAYTLRLAVNRTGSTGNAASVTWTSAHVTTDDTDFLDGTGTLEWEAGDNDPKFIEIDILATAVAATDQTFTVTLTAPVGATLATGANVTTVTLVDNS